MIVGIIFMTFLLTVSARLVWAHEHHAPHQGTLVELGEEFAHLELLLDAATGHLSAYVLDGEAENPVRISQSSLQIKVKDKKGSYLVKLKAVANNLTGEKVGNTSEFQGEFKKLKGLSKFEGTIVSIKAKGETFKSVWFLYPEGNEGVEKPKEERGTNGKSTK
jgi:hypothetical protein